MMDTCEPSMNNLFRQLGLPYGDDDIENFISRHHLDQEQKLSEAAFWTPDQARFLSEAWDNDADWIVIVDELNVRLHH